MNKNKVFYLIVIVLFLFIIIYINNRSIIALPDKIIIHNYDKLTEVPKNSAEFNEIIKLTKRRFHVVTDSAKDAVNDSIMQSVFKDGIGIEFIYNSEKKSYLDIFNSIKYDKLYFQLTSNTNEDISETSNINIFQHGYKGHYNDSSKGPLKYSKKLVDLINLLK